jgi:hypothetical protein
MNTYSVQEVMKARCQDLEDLLAAVMKLEQETGAKLSINIVKYLNVLIQANKLPFFMLWT